MPATGLQKVGNILLPSVVVVLGIAAIVNPALLLQLLGASLIFEGIEVALLVSCITVEEPIDIAPISSRSTRL